MSSPRRVGGPVRWVDNLSGVHGTCATMSPMVGGNTAMTIRGQGLRCLEAVRAMCC
jgi:hypothetical protein